MATSTLIQSLDTKDSAGVAVGATPSNRRQLETFIAGAAISAGDWVSLDLSKSGAIRATTVIKTTAVVGQTNVIGVALRSASTGDKVDVVVEGYVEGAAVVSGVLSGEGLATSGVTAGRALKFVPGTHFTLCGMALENATVGNTAAVLVFKQAF
jgi:hypothetical protein